MGREISTRILTVSRKGIEGCQEKPWKKIKLSPEKSLSTFLYPIHVQSLSNPFQTSKELYGFTAGSQGMDLPQLDPCLGCCKVPTYRWIRWDISMGFPLEKYDKYGLWIHSMRSLHRRGRTRSPMFTFGSILSGIT
jgi:hypothetical protein